MQRIACCVGAHGDGANPGIMLTRGKNKLNFTSAENSVTNTIRRLPFILLVWSADCNSRHPDLLALLSLQFSQRLSHATLVPWRRRGSRMIATVRASMPSTSVTTKLYCSYLVCRSALDGRCNLLPAVCFARNREAHVLDSKLQNGLSTPLSFKTRW